MKLLHSSIWIFQFNTMSPTFCHFSAGIRKMSAINKLKNTVVCILFRPLLAIFLRTDVCLSDILYIPISAGWKQFSKSRFTELWTKGLHKTIHFLLYWMLWLWSSFDIHLSLPTFSFTTASLAIRELLWAREVRGCFVLSRDWQPLYLLLSDRILFDLQLLRVF